MSDARTARVEEVSAPTTLDFQYQGTVLHYKLEFHLDDTELEICPQRETAYDHLRLSSRPPYASRPVESMTL